MRIALVIERFEPGGGVEGVAWVVAHRLAEAGDQVTVVARQVHPDARVPVRRVSVPALWQPARVLAFSAAAARAAPRGRFDVVHSFSRTRHQDVYRAGGGCHADYLDHRHGPLGRRVRRLSPRHAVLLGLEARIFGDPSQLVQCNSALVRDQIARRFGVEAGRLVVLPNGVDTERFHPTRHGPAAARLRAELADSRGPVWLFVGSGFRRKGLDTALRALARARRPGAQLWVAGRDAPGPWQRLAERLGLAPHVRFLGPRSDLEVVYAAADALVLPTRYDAFANVCLEAAASGLPVVTSEANGAAATLRRAGIVVKDPEDAEGFAHALDLLWEEPRRRQLGAEGRRIAESQDWEEHLRGLRTLYARVAR